MTRASTTMTKCAALLLCSSSCSLRCWAFSSSTASSHGTRPIPVASSQCLRAEETEWTSDFDDYIPASKGGADDPESSSSSSSAAPTIGSIFQSRKARDWSGVETRQFSLGEDLVLANFVGKMGFDEVTDWEYYYENEEDPDDRKVVRPNPFDESKPKRTRQSSGSVVRVFRGEFVGRLGGTLRSQGLDNRVLVKEFAGKMALQLARHETASVGKLQSDLLADDEDAAAGTWIQMASSRSVTARTDDSNVCELVRRLSTGVRQPAPYLGILGEVNLAELEGEWDPNEFYRALGVPPPKPGAIWIVYEYAGLNTCASYSEPAQVRRARIPPKKTFFGVREAPPLPAWRDRADYVAKGIMRGAIEALATLHDAGIAHRSLGRSSVILTTRRGALDKAEPASVYATDPGRLSVKLADFGFSGSLEGSTRDAEFLRRARSFGFSFREGDDSLAATNFAMAEDLHALGFVFLGLILSALAELPRLDHPMPATDEDTLQRLLGEIFDKDMEQFREYVEAEEEVWGNLVGYLDENDGAGWTVLETLFKAREKAAENRNSLQVITARGLLSNPFFR